MRHRHITCLVAVLFLSISSYAGVPGGSVKIGGCSGTLIAKGKQWAYGISAAHCATVGENAQVTLESGKVVTGEWVSVSQETDLSLFKIPAESVSRWSNVGVPGAEFIGNGLNGVKKLQYKEVGTVYEDGTKRRLLRAEYKVKSGKFDNGDSGGGIFSDGKLVGVISHGSKEDNVLAATHQQVISFVAKQKSLSYKVTTPDGDRWGDKERTEEIIKLKKRIGDLEKLIASIQVDKTPGKTGPAGPPGPAGATGPVGPAGKAGVDGTNANTSSMDARLATVERWIRNFRAVVRVKLAPEGE